MNKTKTLKVIALILSISAILLAALPNVSAQTDTLYIYSTIGGTISANGSPLTGGSSYNYDNGSVVTFVATPDSGYKFLTWVDLTAAGGTTNNTTPLSYTVAASGAIEALFLPTSNATAVTPTTGSPTVVIMNSAGGTTNPIAGTYTNFTANTINTFSAIPGTGFKFLYWMIAPSTANTYTTSDVSWNVTNDVCALQAYFVPESSTVTISSATPTPAPSATIPEFSGIATVAIAAVLVAVALGTYTYRKKAKN